MGLQKSAEAAMLPVMNFLNISKRIEGEKAGQIILTTTPSIPRFGDPRGILIPYSPKRTLQDHVGTIHNITGVSWAQMAKSCQELNNAIFFA